MIYVNFNMFNGCGLLLFQVNQQPHQLMGVNQQEFGEIEAHIKERFFGPQNVGGLGNNGVPGRGQRILNALAAVLSALVHALNNVMVPLLVFVLYDLYFCDLEYASAGVKLMCNIDRAYYQPNESGQN